MAALNIAKAIIAGHLTDTPELKSTQSGTPVTSFTVAVNSGGADSKPIYLRVNAWRKQAEFISRYFKKGMAIYLEAQISVREYTTKSGEKRLVTEYVANEVRFVEAKSAIAVSEDFATSTPTDDQMQSYTSDEDLPF